MSIANDRRRLIACMLTAVLCCLLSQPALAEITPYSGDKSAIQSEGQLVGMACGFVETTWDDPDWVMVTSDHILRSHDCVAECAACPECWYNLPFYPCYPTNRYWKFTENSGTAFAFPMAALGVGTFDGLFLRRNVKFQLYYGSDESHPYGPAMTGPIYLSVTCWRDVYVACEGFEPGTFFVAGDPGALTYYSMKIGGDTNIQKIDVKKADNMLAHHTDKFKDDFVLRRGASFDVKVTLGQEYGPKCHEVYFDAAHSFDGTETHIDVLPCDTPPPIDQWGAQFVSAVTNADRTKTVTTRVYIPANAAIGKYTFKAFVRNKGTSEPTDEREFDDPTFIVFNPWSSDDAVYVPTISDLREFILQENGLIWTGSSSSNSSSSWRFDQFNHKTLSVTMNLLEGVTSTDRADPRLISRYLSKMTNSNDDNGVVEGYWGDSFVGGKPPWYWSGSDQIIAAYAASKTPVRYGQCWVFGGVLTSLLRCVGIPARPLSNFSSAHDADKPVNKAVDKYFDTAGHYDRARTKDSVWNFHVWCDAWINGWNAVDGTPQERSSGVYQLGPAPQTAIRNNLGGPFDVDFVFAEVDAVVKYWYAQSNGVDLLTRTDATEVGRNITTKAAGANSASDITGAYKTPETTSMRIPLVASNVDVMESVPDNIGFGSDIVWKVQLTNNSGVSRTAHVILAGSAIGYDGSFFGTVGAADTGVDLDPGEVDSVTLTIPVSAYLAWTGVTNTFEAEISTSIVGTSDILLDTRKTVVVGQSPNLTLTGDVPVGVGNSVNLRADWTNPLSSRLDNVVVLLSVGDGLSLGGVSNIEVALGALAPGENLSLARDITALSEGTHYATAKIFADQLTYVSAYQAIPVFSDCNGNGESDLADINEGFSNDCNSNSIPDECETDCNGNGTPDGCDILQDPAIDCNANGSPDVCDLASGTSADGNTNHIPDECELDCNNNHVPDDIDIATGASSDFNHNGVPDECDVDCNGNGISDEIDIAFGESSDNNHNGVPDECESAVNAPPVAVCSNVTIAADTTCFADASVNNGSYDPDGDPITLSQDPPGPYPIGTTTVTLTATDNRGGTDTCRGEVTVIDAIPPDITVELSRDVLWPPKGKMVDITAKVTVKDGCCANPTFVLESVTCNELDDEKGNGKTVAHIQGADVGRPDTCFQLCSERKGRGQGRIYTIVYVGTDCAGNAVSDTTYVRVPHDQSGHALSSIGFLSDGSGFYPTVDRYILVIPSNEGGFDATQLDVRSILVGNSNGIVHPDASLVVDIDANGLDDLAVCFSVAGTKAVMGSPGQVDGDAVSKDEFCGPIGLHYVDRFGADFLVPNIFALGAPVSFRLPDRPPDIDTPEHPYEVSSELQRHQELRDIPGTTAISSVFPNPSNPTTTIGISVAKEERVKVQICNMWGVLVRTLTDNVLPVGEHSMVWDGCDSRGHRVATGIYFVRLNAGSCQATRKIVVLK